MYVTTVKLYNFPLVIHIYARARVYMYVCNFMYIYNHYSGPAFSFPSTSRSSILFSRSFSLYIYVSLLENVMVNRV